MIYDAIILGGGASGLFCASLMAKQGKSVLLLDHNKKLARKIKVSGGGRCNFTNLGASPADYICASPHFVKAALRNFTPQDFLDIVESYHIDWQEKELGQAFTTEGSGKIIHMLIDLCQKAKVDIKHPVKIDNVEFKKDVFELQTSQGLYTAAKLIVATGGLSFKALGASGLGYDIARQFGHKVTPLKPALVGLEMAEDSALAGLSFKVKASYGKQSFTHNLLFTHKGLSGPAILQISNYWQSGEAITLDLCPDTPINEAIEKQKQQNSKSTLSQLMRSLFPKNFATYFMYLHRWNDIKIAEMNKKQITVLSEQIHHWQLTPIGHFGYDKAEVTCGGVETCDISAKTMESRLQKGLYFIGEVLDVTGQLGGYNLQWAWSSAALAAQDV